ncbi:MAG: class I SAM-dependent methyltransferase [Roseiflexaceae bacterium]|nr:class I SAM-dependent methyltransferase [Roseiflexaceae bacterium]MDW8234626.1 class I SAM-dependent methyltransferase [Roseiflexaceae bacterium]
MTGVLPIRFDAIAGVYDQVRGHPPEVAEQIGRAIAALAGNDALVLELGIGTGRIALPVALAGCRVVGIDISAAMLRVARAKDGGEALWLLQGDIEHLPFADGVFDATLAVHVLHLARDWRSALAEALRVLRPGGIFVQGRDWRDPQSCVGRLRSKLRETVMELLPGSRPPGAGAAIGQALAKLGATVAPEMVAASWVAPISPAQVLEEMAARSDAETWVLDDVTLNAALERLRAWAVSVYDDLNQPEMVERRFVLQAARLSVER